MATTGSTGTVIRNRTRRSYDRNEGVRSATSKDPGKRSRGGGSHSAMQQEADLIAAGYEPPLEGGTTNRGAGDSTGGNGNQSQEGRVSGMAAKLGFNYAQLQDQIWRDPQMVLAAMYAQDGVGLNSPMYSTLRELYGADPQSLWMLTAGTQKGYHGDANDYANYLANLYSGLQTPGGAYPTFDSLIAGFQGLGDQSSLEPEQQSPLYALLNQGNAADQFRTYYGLVSDAAKIGLSPIMAQALLGQLALKGDQYLTATAQSSGGNMTPFYQYDR